MDEETEIDLKKIIGKLIQNWWWIVGITLLAGLAAGLYSYFQPRVYRAQAVISISHPRYLPNFDVRYQTINTTPLGSRAILDIARSDQIQVSVFEEWQNPNKRIEDRQPFRNNALKASEGSDATIIFLAVVLESAEEAARLANYWAELVVERANQLYSGADEAQVKFFESQIGTSMASLEAAEAKLVDFEGRSEIEPMKNQYNELLLIQKEALRKQRMLSDAVRDAEGLLEQASALGGDQIIPGWLNLNLTLLQIRVYGDSSSPGVAGVSPVQLQLSDSVGLQPVTATDFRTSIQNWIQTSMAQIQELEELQIHTAAAVFNLQHKIQNLENEKQRLLLDYQLSKDTYTIMTKKYDEAKITFDDTSGDTQIASLSIPPQSPESRNVARNGGMASVLGFIFAVVLILLKDWWETSRLQVVEPSLDHISS
jgi:uncharacterized protein involved in exopolysaccharide biosynthesis